MLVLMKQLVVKRNLKLFYFTNVFVKKKVVRLK